MEFRHFKHLIAVHEHKTFAAAARSLDLSQQALSQSIAALERELDVKLFERTRGTGPAELTLFGRALLRHAKRVLTETDRAEAEIRLLRDAAAGEVRVGIGEALAGGVSPLAVEQFRALHPGAKLILEEGYTDRLLERLVAGELDLVAGGLPNAVEMHADLAFMWLGETHDRVICRRLHPLATKRKLSIRDLRGYPWLVESKPSGEYEVIVNAFVRAGLEAPSDLVWSDAPFTGTALLLRNDFLVLAPRDMHATLIEAGLLTTLSVQEPSRVRRCYIAHRRHAALSPAALALIAQLQEAQTTDATGSG